MEPLLNYTGLECLENQSKKCEDLYKAMYNPELKAFWLFLKDFLGNMNSLNALFQSKVTLIEYFISESIELLKLIPCYYINLTFLKITCN